MAEIYADPFPVISDDLTIPQFFLDNHDPLRPVNKELTPWLIEDASGRRIGYEEVRNACRRRHICFRSRRVGTRPHLWPRQRAQGTLEHQYVLP